MLRGHARVDVDERVHRPAVDRHDHVTGLELAEGREALLHEVDARTRRPHDDLLARGALGDGARDHLGALHVL